jgi:hypothetical protein
VQHGPGTRLVESWIPSLTTCAKLERLRVVHRWGANLGSRLPQEAKAIVAERQ